MTPKEAQVEFRKLAESIGPKAEVFVYVPMRRYDPNEGSLDATIYPDGMGRSSLTRVTADDFETLLDRVRVAWAAHEETRRNRLVKALALKIIELTAEHGECTKAMLRAESFEPADVDRYAAIACTLADGMAGLGPFKVLEAPGSNAGGADE
jgi:hypothetical protein